MERVISSEIGKFVIVAGLIVAGLSAWMSKVMSRISGGVQLFQKSMLIYLFVTLCAFGFIVIAERLINFTELSISFIFFQMLFFLAGIVNVICMERILRWNDPAKQFKAGLFFTAFISLLGSIVFLLLYHCFHTGIEYTMAPAILFFPLPFLIYQCFLKVLAIPPKMIKQWYYPANEEIMEPDERQLKNLLVISFEFQKQTGSNHYTNFRAKAPVDMPLGELFYYFINDYNERHQNERIEVADKNGNPVPWIFNKKPAWYSLKTCYQDYERSVFQNHIRENDIIICTRMEPVPELNFSTLK